MKILVVANTYPTLYSPNFGAFVYNLVQQFTEEHEVIVISPLKFTDLFRKKNKTYGIENCQVIRPLYISFGNKKIGFLNLGKLSSFLLQNAFNRGFKQIDKVDVVYTHFINNGLRVKEFVKKNKLPLYIASGESTYENLLKKPESKIKDLDKLVNHYIAVSTKNEEGLLQLGIDKDKITLVPNAVDYEIFKPIDKSKCKEKLGIPKDKFVIGFIGHFIHRKGPNRVIQAIKKLQNPNIHLICVGNGGELESNDFTTILPPMPNFLLNEVYNAFDVFVLPTLHEGHCNVIEEAKAACIPIISSLGTSVENQIDQNTGILIDPNKVDQISQAILEIYQNEELKEKLINGLYHTRGSNSIQNRAKRILNIIS